MMFHPTIKIYTPIAWILMSGKTEECYWQAFNWLTSELGEDCNPYCVGVDFERAFFRQVKLYFPEAYLIGYLFHFKQALRKKMADLGINEDQIKFAMRKEMLDLLTVLPKEDPEKGLHYIRCNIAAFVEENASVMDFE